MNRVGMLEFVWLRLRRLPRSVWISGVLAMLILPALLLWLALSLLAGAWQAGSAWLGQSRDALQSALPANVELLARDLPSVDAALGALQSNAQQRVQREVERLGAAIPASAEAVQLAANAHSETVEFESPQRTLALAVRNDGRGGSELDWDVR